MRTITSSNDTLSNVKEIFWTHDSKVIRGGGSSWPVPGKELRLGNDWYLEKYNLLHSAQPHSVIIDAGCKTGDWIGIVNHILPPNIITIGIDPINYNVMSGQVTYYHECAIDNVDEKSILQFHIFDEPGCNSLLSKSEHLTMRNALKVITVPVQTLESILLEHVSPETTIHYLKCDCQGKDADVVKSLRSFLPFTRYIQIECSFDKNQPFYIDQPSYEDDVKSLVELGFEPIYFMDYLESPLPEGEIIFQNTNLL
jgi:FkbM family methyltransferase